MRRALLAALVLATTHARADDIPPKTDYELPKAQPPDPPPPPPKHEELAPELVARLRELYDAKDYAGVRRELLAAYRATKNPALLFALGQVELQLEHYAAAIDYYERFIATNPPTDQFDLAQQAIGAARMQRTKQKPRRHRFWTLGDSLIVIGGSAAIAGGWTLFAYGRHKSLDDNGTLTDYADRVDRARTMQWTGVALAGVGFATIATAIIRWRLRPEDGYEVTATPMPGGATATVEWRW